MPFNIEQGVELVEARDIKQVVKHVNHLAAMLPGVCKCSGLRAPRCGEAPPCFLAPLAFGLLRTDPELALGLPVGDLTLLLLAPGRRRWCRRLAYLPPASLALASTFVLALADGSLLRCELCSATGQLGLRGRCRRHVLLVRRCLRRGMLPAYLLLDTSGDARPLQRVCQLRLGQSKRFLVDLSKGNTRSRSVSPRSALLATAWRWSSS